MTHIVRRKMQHFACRPLTTVIAPPALRTVRPGGRRPKGRRGNLLKWDCFPPNFSADPPMLCGGRSYTLAMTTLLRSMLRRRDHMRYANCVMRNAKYDIRRTIIVLLIHRLTVCNRNHINDFLSFKNTVDNAITSRTITPETLEMNAF